MLIFVLPISVMGFTPNDTYFDKQWHLRQIGAPEAWDYYRANANVIVAVLDTGIDITHPDLDGAIWLNQDEVPGNGIDDDNNGYIDDIHGWNFINGNNEVRPNFSTFFSEDGISHGTSVASVVAAEGDNKLGIAGVAFGAKIMPVKVLDELGNGDTQKVAEAVYYAVDNGASVINLSFVGFNSDKDMETAVKRAWEAGVVVVAAAGNTPSEFGGTDLNYYDEFPICIDQYEDDEYVLGVAATDPLDQKGRFSNFGEACVNVSAPGMNIFSARVYNPTVPGYDKFYNEDWSGTSFAAPIVSGVAALIKSANPGLTAYEINEIIVSSGDNIDGMNPDYIGDLGTRVNALAALRLATSYAENGSMIVLGSPAGFSPYVRKIGSQGNVKSTFSAFENFYLGFNARMGDLNADGAPEIVVGAGRGGGPQIRIFDQAGNLTGQFFAYDSGFRGGVEVALGDTNGNGSQEIITAPGPGGGPHILVYNNQGEIRGNFMAADKDYRGGLSIAAGDVNRDGDDEIIVGLVEDGEIYIKIFRRNGDLINSFFIEQKIEGKLLIEAMDLDADVQEEIVIGFREEGQLYLMAFEVQGEVVAEYGPEPADSLFDMQSYFDYLNAETRLLLSTQEGNYLELNYFNNNLFSSFCQSNQ
ncbi:S8 family serine peptidase [Patescibacteria group bacterium]|nr:S8 family serine peptidase [Patescibacteria group bacterium]